jgi:hypothetical protein
MFKTYIKFNILNYRKINYTIGFALLLNINVSLLNFEKLPPVSSCFYLVC